MADWNFEKVACRRTWFALCNLDQISREPDFLDMGGTKVKQFAFWIPGSSADMTRHIAKGLAAQMINVFVNFMGVSFETDEGHSPASALVAMTDVLTDGDKDLSELAAVVDVHVRFRGEN